MIMKYKQKRLTLVLKRDRFDLNDALSLLEVDLPCIPIPQRIFLK